MKKEVGLWIDHRETVFVTIENGVEVVRKIKSNAAKQVLNKKSTKAYDAKNKDESGSKEMLNRKFEKNLNQYYDGVISFIRNADSILIFGPGKAKVEFENRLIENQLGEHIVGVETVGKMTEIQISAKVRNYYSHW
ncbi:MAG: hypothetical protein JEZ00_10330 [Anaerolineaceae bacterium]|nr:hypothetical protein [Anaerolineaceae bacterium]